MTKFKFLIIALSLLVTQLKAQKFPLKFGDIKESELNMKVYDKDTSAAAVILSEYAEINYDINPAKRSYVCKTARTERIKILKKTGLEYATVELATIESNGNKERINNFKGFTYNLVNGKIEKIKIGLGDKLVEKKDENEDNNKFTFKNVQVGSVIEYTYEIESDFITSIAPWNFQHSIPCVFSEILFDVPEMFTFRFSSKGYQKFDINEQESFNSNFMINGRTIPTQLTRYKWGMNDIPAFKKEPYSTASKNYISSINFHIAAIKSPNGVVHSYAQSWDDVCKYLRESEHFGEQLKPSKWIKELAAQLSQGKSQKEAMQSIYDYVKTNMKWNERNSCRTHETLEKAFKAKTGNSADINLLVTVLLKQVGIIAYPVVLSTRKNGKVMPGTSTIDDLNYVVTRCLIDGTEYTIDATEKNAPLGFLPERCLNDQGWIYKDLILEPVKIIPSGADKSVVTQMLSFSDGKFKGKIQERKFEYTAFELRENLSNEKEEKWIEKLEKANNGLKINALNFTNKDSLNKPIISLYEVEISDNADVTDQMIYFKPLLFEKKTKNIFETEKRLYPVEFPEPISETVNTNINIPEGYSVAELPKDTVFKTEDNSVLFLFKATSLGNSISITSKLEVKKTIFLPEEYAELRKIFTEIVAKHQDQVVLKKI